MSETPIVGIGASAGGVEDIVELLSLLPKKREYACVILLHSSGEKSLKEFLAEAGYEVLIVDVPVVPTASMIYLPKPHCDIVFEKGVLKSVPSRSIPTPSIDRFFLDIGYKLKERSVGVLLSGTGRDGVFGLQAIALNGGETFVKDPKKSRFGQLAQEAIEAGVVDYVDDIAGIAQAFGKMWQEEHSFYIDLEPLYRLYEKRVDLRLYKEEMIQKRLKRRMEALGLDYEAYMKLLQKDPKERERLLERILIQVTSFFRDREAFEALEDILKRSGKKELRIWDVGCSSVEEAYSLAIMLQKMGVEGTIFASDIDERAIERARKGCYSYAQINKIEHYERYFDQVGDGYCLKESIRQKVVFFSHDLSSKRLLTELDLIVCRNVLIYLKPEVIEEVLEMFANALQKGGLLFLGKGETVPYGCELFEEVDLRNKIFRKRFDAQKMRDDGESKRSAMEIDALNEELEAMNEELRYANEELQRSYAQIKEFYEKEQHARKELEKRIYQVEVLKEEIFAQREFYRSILDSLHSFVVLMEDDRIKYVNRAFLDFLGIEDVERLREFVHDDICTLFVPFSHPDFVGAKECREQEELDGVKVAMTKDGQRYYFTLHKKRFGHSVLVLLEDITPIFRKKLDLQSMFVSSYRKYALFQNVLRHHHSIFLSDAIVAFIEEEIHKSLGAIYTRVAEIEEYCEMEEGLFEEVRAKKERVLELLEFLDLKERTELVSVQQLRFYCQKLQELIRKRFAKVEFSCEVEVVHIDDRQGLLKDLLLLLVHLEILLNEKVTLRIVEKEGRLSIHASSLRYVQNVVRKLNEESEAIDIGENVAFLVYEILADIYKAKFGGEKVVLPW